MRHIMIDLETIGNGPQAPIVQIGAIVFESMTGEMIEGEGELKPFYNNADLTHCLDKFKPDMPTIEWWLEQSDAARKVVFSPGYQKTPLEFVLKDLRDWLGWQVTRHPDVKIWSHATFDPPIIANAFKVFKIPMPVDRKAWMDIRTLKYLHGNSISGLLPQESFGEAHDALADCRYQAHYVSKMLQAYELRA